MRDAARQPPIEDHAFIGDTRTGALVSSTGSIDWMCAPRFDSEPLFGSLVGGHQAGAFALKVAGATAVTRRYRRDSAVLETQWMTPTGRVEVTDAMVTRVSGRLLPLGMLVRDVRCTTGIAEVDVSFHPRLGLPGREPRSERRNGALVCSWGSLAVALQVLGHPEALEPDHRLVLHEGDRVTYVLSFADRSPLVFVDAATARSALEDTDRWWRQWAGELEYDGRYRDAVVRSMITLRMLTYSPSGAPVAALTTSLPEIPGGPANWDYRFSWPRDAGIALAAFLALGQHEEAHVYMHWLLHASRLTRPRLEVLYTVHGKPGPPEHDLTELPGYQGARPVRVGNGASEQHQLDVYGWVVDGAWNLVERGQDLHGATWRAVSGFADYVADHWQRPDAGIWESRGDEQHYVESKAMAWLALDRALKMADRYQVRAKRRQRWQRQRDALLQALVDHGYNRQRRSFTQAFGSDQLDAAVLIMPALGLPSELRPMVESTVEVVRRELDAGGGLLYRYLEDGGTPKEGAFLPCSFWLVQALAALGRTDEAAELFESLLPTANDVGLLSEEMEPTTRRQLGNFPQAFTHATLVQAALALRAAGDRR